MEPAEYAVMRQCEERHWWYVGLHEMVQATIEKTTRGLKAPRVLDAGCGTGGLLEKIQRHHGCSVGLEYSTHAFKQMQTRSLSGLVKGDIRQMPFEMESFDVLTSMDVLCALEGDDIKTSLAQMLRVLKPGGYLILNLPAYAWLYSGHDAFVGNRTRFYRPVLLRLLKESGFEINQATYRNSVLCPLAVVARLLKSLLARQGRAYASDVKMPHWLFNKAFLTVLRLENKWIGQGLRLPFGLSIFVVARKPDIGAFQFTAAVSSMTR